MLRVQFEDLGMMDYQAAWDYQTARHRALVDNKRDNGHLPPGTYPQQHTLIFTEHPPVYTLGKSGSMTNLLLSETQLEEKNIQFFPINRGGDITFHGPGQVIGYPILDLECFFTDISKFVRSLEEAIIRTIAMYGVVGTRVEGYTGVWIQGTPASGHIGPDNDKKRKICAIGVHLSRWVTLHGWALNVTTPLDYFNYIIPCGIAEKDKSVTSLQQEIGYTPDIQEVKDRLKHHFAEIFQCQLF